MKPIVFVLLAFLASCSSTVKTADNRLTKTDESNGWKLLFDGQTMTGWRTYQNKPADSWTVNNGTLYCKGSTTDKSDRRADLMTTGQYENFDLELDWKLAPQGNSGIIYLVTEDYPAAYQSGPEYQLIDDVNFPEKLEDWQRTGANYAMNPPSVAASKPAGEWNHTRIVVNNGHVEHWLNGKKVVDYQLWTDEWKNKKSTGKWKDAPGYGGAKKGYIALQDHGSEAWFKNIRVKEL
jgi:hypothetical protein